MGKTIILVLLVCTLIGDAISAPLLADEADAGFKSVAMKGCNSAGNRGPDGRGPDGRGPPPSGPPPSGGGGPPPTTTASSR